MAKVMILGSKNNRTFVRNMGETVFLFTSDGGCQEFHNVRDVVITGEKENRQVQLFLRRKDDKDATAWKVMFWMLLSCAWVFSR